MGTQWRSGVLARLQALLESLGSGQRAVAEFILTNPERSVHLSAREIGNLSNTSEATVVRLCQTLGYDGYKHLRLNLAHDLADNMSLERDEIRPSDGIGSIADKLLAAYTESLESTLQIIDTPTVEAAVATLAQADRIEIWGHGGNTIAVTHAHHHFLKLSIPSHPCTDFSLQLMTASVLKPGNVVLAFSNTGRNPELASALTLAREAGATVILVTSNPRAPLTEIAHLTLCTAPRESVYADEPLTTPANHLYLIDILFISIVQKLGLEANLRITQSVLTGRRMKRSQY